ncbi:MAG: CocE/NonD family hydrolase [Promethearchaeota archaeon]|nr:MAG: CocE/NonD family hydrolase [Candidatus Lokiarchaeota archaeon]
MQNENLDINPFKFNGNSVPNPFYKEYSTSSTYIPMRDGIKIAVDLYLPKPLPSDKKLSTILSQTRYWRAINFRKPFSYFLKSLSKKDYIKVFTSYGYAFLSVDVRGSGASFGYRISPWSEDEVKDSNEIVDWIIAQSWSNGNVFAFGNSYAGTTAELVAVSNHPAVKGVVPMHNEIDPYLDIAFPGGIFNQWFVKTWAHYNDCLDRNSTRGLGLLAMILTKGVKPIDSDINKLILKKAIAQHVKNLNVFESGKNLTFRDDNWDEKKIKSFSVYRYKEDIERSNIPMYYWGSWMDGSTSNVVIESFLTFKNPFIGVIGAWTHGSIWYASPYIDSKKEVIPNYDIQFKAYIRFFENCLKGSMNSKKILYYYTMGEEKWKKTTNWPPNGQIKTKWYFHESSELSQTKPNKESGTDNYKINFNASTGKKTNRWYTQMGGFPVIYKNIAKKNKKLLTYTSRPLLKDIEITGYPIITLFLTSTHEDGAVFAYLEDVDVDGKVYLITEGYFRVIHRKISDKIPPYKTLVPYHTFEKDDALPLVPGQISEISFGLLPTSVLIRKGHSIRIAIAGADKDTFIRIPTEGSPVITISRNSTNASFIEIPIIEK